MINYNKISLLLAIVLSFLAGQSFAADPDSGFLQNYSDLQADKDRPGAKFYMKPGADLGLYTRIAISPIEIWYHPETKYKGISPDQLKVITDNYRDILVQNLEPEYPVVSKGGKGVLQLNLAITNVMMTKKKRTILNYTPGGFAMYTLKDAAGANVIMSDAFLEAELIDSATGEQIGILVDQQKETAKKGKASWKNLEKALTYYAQRFRQRMDSTH